MSLMIRRLLRRLTFKKAKQNPSCAILQLPVEMILLIFEHLSEYERIILAQTCFSLRGIFSDNYKAREDGRHPLSSGQLGIDQRSWFLSTLAYRQPNLLACYLCMKTHTIDQNDTPLSWVKYDRCRQPVTQENSIYRGMGYVVYHRHVQLALKYTRLLKEEGNGGPVLQRKYKEYLNNLMQPYSSPIQPGEHGMTNKITGALSVSPKVADGRFISQSTWKFDKSAEDVSHESLGTLHICKHQILLPYIHSFLSHLPQISRYQALRDYFRAWGAIDPNWALEAAITDALETGEETFGSCFWCETDFAVQASSETAVVRAWQHLGSETTYVDNQSWKWMTHFGRDSPGFHSRPGSIRQLYEQALSEGTPLKNDS